jgi:hypothetical protein
MTMSVYKNRLLDKTKNIAMWMDGFYLEGHIIEKRKCGPKRHVGIQRWVLFREMQIKCKCGPKRHVGIHRLVLFREMQIKCKCGPKRHVAIHRLVLFREMQIKCKCGPKRHVAIHRLVLFRGLLFPGFTVLTWQPHSAQMSQTEDDLRAVDS